MPTPTELLFLATSEDRHALVMAVGREGAKRLANKALGGNSDSYVVTPLTSPGDTISLFLEVRVY